MHFNFIDFFLLLTECGEVYGRLFDHKPVIRGEINFFLREFEVLNCILLILKFICLFHYF